MTSCQRRKNEILFYQQCVSELEQKCRDLVKNKGKVLLCGEGLTGDEFITPYNNGEFDMTLRGGA